MARILCVEDDRDIADLICYNLERAGHECDRAEDGWSALEMIRSNPPDLVVLDVMLPRINGVQVCRQLRGEETFRKLPILMLTARTEEDDVVQGLEAGADDYVSKPFSPRELSARVNSLLRRSATAPDSSQTVNYPGLEIDIASHDVVVDGEVVKLTLSEYRLLLHLARNPDRVFSRSDLLDRIAGRDAYIIDRNVDVHVRGVRKKIGRWAAAIVTVRGVGYKFTPSRATDGLDHSDELDDEDADA